MASQISDSTPNPEPTGPSPDAPSPELEPVETGEVNTSAETTVQPTVLQTLPDSTPLSDRELPAGLSEDLETGTAPVLCPKDGPDSLCPDQADPGSPDVGPEVETADPCGNPEPGLTATLMGNRSPVPLPRRGTRPRKQSERYTLVRRLQVLPVNQAQTGPTIWLFPTIGIAETLSNSSPSCPTNTLNSEQTDIVLLGMSCWPSFRTLGLELGNECSC